jgi:hypothetical protein
MVKFTGHDIGEKKYETLETFAKAFPPGSVVFVTTLNQDGLFKVVPMEKGKFPFSLGPCAYLCLGSCSNHRRKLKIH